MADSVCSSYYFNKRLGSGYHRQSSEAVSRYLHFSLCRTAVCVRSEVVSTAGWLINKQLWLFSKGSVFRNSSAVLQLSFMFKLQPLKVRGAGSAQVLTFNLWAAEGEMFTSGQKQEASDGLFITTVLSCLSLLYQGWTEANTSEDWKVDDCFGRCFVTLRSQETAQHCEHKGRNEASTSRPNKRSMQVSVQVNLLRQCTT